MTYTLLGIIFVLTIGDIICFSLSPHPIGRWYNYIPFSGFVLLAIYGGTDGRFKRKVL